MDLTRRSLLGLGARDADRRTLVVVFLRGGADGLSLVPPYADDAYHTLRPTLAISAPRVGSPAASDRAVDLDGFFGLHPRLAPLLPLFREGGLGVVHAVGSDDGTRSHFEAQDRMELAGATAQSAASGWITRHLATRAGASPGPLAAVAFGPRLPESLRGAASATAMESLRAFRLGGGDAPAAARALAELYAGGARATDLAGAL
ncbi:MAG TPA: hypothetical protein VHB21_10790, partial [Minicystis sp.]|nr:hypothetical protein [Minicystis sp.]